MLLRRFHALAPIEAFTITVIERPHAGRITKGPDVLLATLADERGGIDVVIREVRFAVTPSIDEPILEDSWIRLLVAVGLPVGKMPFPVLM